VVGHDGGESLVDQPDRHRRDPRGQRGGEVPRAGGRLPLPAGQARGQSDDDLDGLAIGGQPGQLIEVAATALDGRERAGQQARGIAGGHADPGQPGVDPEPDARPQVASLRVAWRTTVWRTNVWRTTVWRTGFGPDKYL